MLQFTPTSFTWLLGIALFLNADWTVPAIAQNGHPRSCATHKVQQMLQQLHPGLAEEQQELKAHVYGRAKTSINQRLANSNENLSIPLAFHVVWHTEADKVSRHALMEQVAILNSAFNGSDPDIIGATPAHFWPDVGTANFTFCLGKYYDEEGQLREAVTYTQTEETEFDSDDAQQAVKSTALGGHDAINPAEYLNIWIAPLDGEDYGYATKPGYVHEWDGIVISPRVFGKNNGSYNNKGKVLVHEVGHYFSLVHTWGNEYCGNDFIDDTPPAEGETYGHFTPNEHYPYNVGVCSDDLNGEMWFNYMTYAADDSRTMFTNGQVAVMRSTLAPGGPRETLLYSNACNLPSRLSEKCCPKVNKLDIVDKTDHSVTLTWLLPKRRTIPGFEVRYRPVWHAEWGQPIHVTENNYKFTGLLEEKTYFFQVRTICSEGNKGNWATIGTNTTGKCNATPPEVRFAATENSITLSWDEVQAADFVQIDIKEVLQSGGGSNPRWGERIKTKGSYTFTGLKPGHLYKVQIVWQCLGGYSGQGKKGSSITTTKGIWTKGCKVPITSVESTTETTITVAVPDGYTDPNHEQLLGAVSAADAVVWQNEEESVIPGRLSFTDLTPNTAYSIRVQAKCADGNLSEYIYLNTATDDWPDGDFAEPNPDPVELSLYPNPAGSGQQIVIEQTSGQQQAFNRLLVMNSRGSVMKDEQLTQTGTCKVNLGRLPAGLYLVVLQQGTRKITKRLIVTPQ